MEEFTEWCGIVRWPHERAWLANAFWIKAAGVEAHPGIAELAETLHPSLALLQPRRIPSNFGESSQR